MPNGAGRLPRLVLRRRSFPASVACCDRLHAGRQKRRETWRPRGSEIFVSCHQTKRRRLRASASRPSPAIAPIATIGTARAYSRPTPTSNGSRTVNDPDATNLTAILLAGLETPRCPSSTPSCLPFARGHKDDELAAVAKFRQRVFRERHGESHGGRYRQGAEGAALGSAPLTQRGFSFSLQIP